MDQDFLQPIIKAMRLLCLMQLMLTYITLDPKPLRWAEEAQCPETNPVPAEAAAKAGLNPAAATLLVVVVAAAVVVVSINVGPVVQRNNFIIVKFVKSLVPVSAKLEPIHLPISNCCTINRVFLIRSSNIQRPLGWTETQKERSCRTYRSSYGTSLEIQVLLLIQCYWLNLFMCSFRSLPLGRELPCTVNYATWLAPRRTLTPLTFVELNIKRSSSYIRNWANQSRRPSLNWFIRRRPQPRLQLLQLPRRPPLLLL